MSVRPTAVATVPSVAIVMRTKDRPLMLRRAVEDVLGQELADWHICLVNDGGDPSSVDDLMNAYAPALAGRVSVIHNSASRGMEAASNQALSQIQSRFFVVHDDDDSWDPGFLGETTAYLDRLEHAGLVGVVTGHVVVHERIEANRIVRERTQAKPDAGARLADFGELLGRAQTPPIAVLFRRSLLARIGPFDPSLPVLGDWEFNLRALGYGDIGVIPRALAYYHIRRDAADGVYANTVTGGRATHEAFGRQLRNRLIRKLLAHAPSMLGFLVPVLRGLETTRDEIAGLLQRHLLSLGQAASQGTSQLLLAVRDLKEGQAASIRAIIATQTELRAEIAALRQELATVRPLIQQ